MVRKPRDARACRTVEPLAVAGHRPAQFGEQPADVRHCLGFVLPALGQNQEFVAANPAEQVVRPECLLHPPDLRHDQPVADGMAVNVVHLFQIVDIDICDPGRLALFRA
jgi:hypothetical protein